MVESPSGHLGRIGDAATSASGELPLWIPWEDFTATVDHTGSKEMNAMDGWTDHKLSYGICQQG